MHLSKFAVRRPVAVTVIVIIALIFGAISLQKIGIDLLPDLNFPVAVVATIYPNAPAETIQQDVTIPIEGALASVSGVRRQDSFSMENVSAIVLQFEWGTDMLSALENIRNNLAQVSITLPEGTQNPVVAQIDPNDFPLLLVGVTADGFSPVELSEQLSKIKPQLEQLPGVAQVSLLGTSEEEIQVLFDPEYLDEIGLTPVILQQLIMYQNIVVPGGTVTDGDVRYSTRTGSQIQSVEELKDIIVGMQQGTGVLGLGGMIPSLTYLSDVAEVTTHVKAREGVTRLNGNDTILLQIMRQSGANTVQVANTVQETLQKIQEENPALQFTAITDQSLFIKNSISSLATSGIIGGFLAVLVLWLFLRNVQSLLIIALSIPISIIASFVLVYFSNLSLNLMTLGGLALGIGMLVDSSIVVLENIYRHRTEGINPQLAAEQGASEVAGAIVASTTTTISVFLPVIFLQSIAGKLFKELGLTISYSLIASLLVSLTVVPMLSAKLLKQNIKVQKNKTKPSFFTRLQDRYTSILQTCLQHKGVVLGLVAAAVAVTVFIYPQLGEEFIPSFDEGFLGVTAILPAGTTINKVKETIIAIEDDLLAIPEVSNVASQAGDQGDTDLLSMMTSGGINTANLSITLKPHNERTRSSKQIVSDVYKIMDRHGVLRTNITDTSLFGSSSSTLLAPNLLIEIRGEDPDVLVDLSHHIMNELEKVPGFRSIQNSRFQSSQDLFLNVDTARSILGGFTAGQVGLGVRYATAGLKATDINVGNRILPVVLRPKSPSSESVDELLNSKITSPVSISGLGESPILLDQVVEPVIGPAPPSIQRTDRLQVIAVTGMLGDDLELSKAAGAAREIIDHMEIPPGYHVRIGGMQEVIEESIGDLYMVLGLAVILVYLVMAAQFESFVQPLIIMFTIPLAFIGSILALWITGGNIGIMSMIGVIVLAGIVVNNAIVLVDYINQQREQKNVTVSEAILEACRVRLRPILMTSITTIFGLIPVALGYGAGSEFQKPLAVTVIGGLLTSTILTLFVIPVVYALINPRHKSPRL